jgi:hypothetical protein
MRRTLLAAIVVTLVGLAHGPAQAQDLQLTASPASRAGIPTRGLTMSEVERKYGAPSDRIAAVGQPPITRWVYPSFVVYFEHNIVIHAVASSAAAQPKG